MHRKNYYINPNLEHLEFYDEENRRIIGRPPKKDYLSEIREIRLQREKDITQAQKIKQVLHSKKLTDLEKMQKIKEEAAKMELLAKKWDQELLER